MKSTKSVLTPYLVLLAACGPAPASPGLNPHVLAVIETYPTDGTHGYHWPREGSWLGFTRTLVYDGEAIGEGDPQGRCHCSGLTFEVFFRAWERRCAERGVPFRIEDLDADGVRAFVRDWFGADGNRRTLAAALEDRGLGHALEDLEDARPGDFVQLWRHSGSGHSCVFLDWVRDEDGAIAGLRYWSTQSSTSGIGTNVERFGESGRSLDRGAFAVVRVDGGP